ncbi:MAG: RadC family protein [Sphingomonadaceae bacterium]
MERRIARKTRSSNILLWCNFNDYIARAIGNQISQHRNRCVHSRRHDAHFSRRTNTFRGKILAYMDCQFSDNSDTLAPAPIADPAHASKSIRDDCDGLGLSDVDHIGMGHSSASGTGSDLRQRQVLERLLACIKGGEPETVAGELLERFGSLGAIFAEIGSLNDDRPSSKLLGAVHQTLKQLLKAEVSNRPILSTGHAVINYLAFAMGHLRVEEVRALYLDSNNCLLRDVLITRGSVSAAPIYPREILKHALDAGATAFLLAHNHPSGDPKPSRSDIEITRRLNFAAKELDLFMHDHLIIARKGWFSFRSEGHIN